MLLSEPQLYILIIIAIVILSGSTLLIYHQVERRNQTRKEIFSYEGSWVDHKKENSLTLKPQNILDPLEEKLLMAIILPINSEGLSVDQLNELLNLSELKESNQRQRRHIIIKELNLKLYLITGLRESIIRTSKRSDKRIKYYTIDLKNVNMIKKLADILLKNQ